MRQCRQLQLLLLGLVLLLSRCSRDGISERICENPDYAPIVVFIHDSCSVTCGTEKKIGIGITCCQHFAAVRIITDCSGFDTTIAVETNAYSDSFYVPVPFTSAGVCTVYITATMMDTLLKDTTVLLPVVVLPENAAIRFFTKPDSLVTHTGRSDTLLYTVKVEGKASLPAKFEITAYPPHGDERRFTMQYSSLQDTLRLLLNPDTAGVFIMTVTASASTVCGGVFVHDSVKTGIKVFRSFIPETVIIPQVLKTGKPDTLLFSVDNSQRPDPLVMTLADRSDDKQIEMTVCETGTDSLVITVIPELSVSDSFTFGIVVSNGVLSDTIRYCLPVVGSRSEDGMPPVIVQTAGPDCDSRTAISAGTLTFMITDSSGIGRVYWKLNGGEATELQVSNDTIFNVDYSLTNYGMNHIRVYARDKSSAENIDSVDWYSVYYSSPSCISLSAPDDDAADVATTPTFSWNGGDDADGDTVYYTVVFGTNPDALYRESATTQSRYITFADSDRLASATRYYWKIVATTGGAFSETVESSIRSFTTEHMQATVTANPSTTMVTEGESASFTVEAAGDPPISFQWLCNGKLVEGANDPFFTVVSVTAADKDSRYACIVGNSLGSDTSKEATLAVVILPFYDVTFECNGGSAVNKQRVKSGEYAHEPEYPPTKVDYIFDGWYSTSGLSRRFNFTGTPIIDDITVYARWTRACRIVYHADNMENGNVPVDTMCYRIGQKTTIAGNTGALSRNGFCFGGWSTDPRGNDVVKQPGEELTIDSVIIDLYVIWKAVDGSGTVCQECGD